MGTTDLSTSQHSTRSAGLCPPSSLLWQRSAMLIPAKKQQRWDPERNFPLSEDCRAQSDLPVTCCSFHFPFFPGCGQDGFYSQGGVRAGYARYQDSPCRRCVPLGVLPDPCIPTVPGKDCLVSPHATPPACLPACSPLQTSRVSSKQTAPGGRRSEGTL